MTSKSRRRKRDRHQRPGLSAQTLRAATTPALYAHLARLTANDRRDNYPRQSHEAQRVRDELNRRLFDRLESITGPISAPGASPLDPESIRYAANLDTGGPMATAPRIRNSRSTAPARPVESNTDTPNRDRSLTHVTEHDRTS